MVGYQLDDETKSLHRKCLDITKHPLENGCLGLQGTYNPGVFPNYFLPEFFQHQCLACPVCSGVDGALRRFDGLCEGAVRLQRDAGGAAKPPNFHICTLLFASFLYCKQSLQQY